MSDVIATADSAGAFEGAGGGGGAGSPVVEPATIEGESTKEGAAIDSGAAKPEGEPDDKKFTQADLERIIGERLARNKTETDKDKADAQAWREYQESQKDEETRRSEEMERLRAENDDLKLERLRSDVVTDKKLPPKLAKFLTGKTREEMEAVADELLESIPKPVAAPDSLKPTPVDSESKRLGGDETPFDPNEIVNRIPRG